MPFLPALIMVVFMAGFLCAFARQLGNPSGWFGRAVMTSFLNRGNRTMIEAAVMALGAKASERIVDVGFGGGSALRLIAPMVAPARVTGIEISGAMIDGAKQRFGETMEIHQANAVAMPFGDGWFDGILSVNTVYFWSDPDAVLREFRRVLKPGGRLVLGIRKKEVIRWSPVTWFGFRLFSSAEIERMLNAAGFESTIQRTGPGELTVVARPKPCMPGR
jgi:SAM-dependent methyltransferase